MRVGHSPDLVDIDVTTTGDAGVPVPAALPSGGSGLSGLHERVNLTERYVKPAIGHRPSGRT